MSVRTSTKSVWCSFSYWAVRWADSIEFSFSCDSLTCVNICLISSFENLSSSSPRLALFCNSIFAFKLRSNSFIFSLSCAIKSSCLYYWVQMVNFLFLSGPRRCGKLEKNPSSLLMIGSKSRGWFCAGSGMKDFSKTMWFSSRVPMQSSIQSLSGILGFSSPRLTPLRSAKTLR